MAFQPYLLTSVIWWDHHGTPQTKSHSPGMVATILWVDIGLETKVYMFAQDRTSKKAAGGPKMGTAPNGVARQRGMPIGTPHPHGT